VDPIKYLPRSDLAIHHYLEKASAYIPELNRLQQIDNITVLMSVYSIIRYIDDGLSEYVGNPKREQLKSLIVDFIKTRTGTEIAGTLNELNHVFHDDFWDFFITFEVYRKLDEVDFGKFLVTYRPNIRPLLCRKPLMKAFPLALKEYFLSDPSNVRFLIEQNESDGFQDWRGKPSVPVGINKEEENQLVAAYIASPDPSFAYLEILAEMSNLPPKIRLAATKKAEEARKNAMSTASTFNVGVKISFGDQKEEVIESYEEGTLKRSYSLNWITANSDNATLLNNFIYLFKFVDQHARIALCYQESECGVMERVMGTRREDRYPESLAYFQKNQAALLALHTYDKVLRDIGTTIERPLGWFFEEYLPREFGISGFQVDLPASDFSFLEKCKLLAPEIERILKQFQMFVEDGHVDLELMSLSSNKFLVTTCKSLLPSKYCYLNSRDAEIATYYFYSDQCMLHYDSKSEVSHETFAQRLLKSSPRQSDFEDYQQSELDWLVSKGYLHINDGDIVEFANIHAVAFLGEIHRNGCLCYHSYSGQAKSVLDRMLSEGTLKSESSLFSRPEQDFVDFHLNRHKYINSLDLRNKYAHGSHAGTQGGEGEAQHDYLQLLKILVCVILKMNDDICTKSEMHSVSTET
jgi:hypothetical protein